MTEDTPQAIDANACWEYILNEVLEAKDWKFATLRYKLAQSTLTPEYGYDYAYGLPADFLRLARTKKSDPNVYLEDTSTDYPHVIETLSDGNMYLLTDFDNTTYDIFIKYIKKVTNPQKYSAAFINALAWRLGAELCTGLTEGAGKFQVCMQMYAQALIMADALNQSLDYLEDETGSDDWDTAGRS